MFRHPIFPQQKRLSHKFLLMVLPPVILSTVLVMGISARLVYQDTRAELVERVKTLARVQSTALAAHLWNFDTLALKQNLKGSVLYPGVARAVVRNPDQKVLASVQNQYSGGRLISCQHPIVFSNPYGNHQVGTLTLWYTHQILHKELIRQLVRDSLLLLLLVAVIVIAALMANHLTIGIPLHRFLNAVRGTDEQGMGATVDWPAKDELGELIRAYNSLLNHLKERERQLGFQAMLLDQIQDAIVATDPEGAITYINEAAAAAVGRSPEELIGQSVHIFNPAPQTQDHIISSTHEHGRWEGTVINTRPDGGETLFESRTWLIRDPADRPAGMVGISNDVTERKRAEEAVRNSQEQLALITDELDALIAYVDTQYRYVYVNQAYAQWYGFTKAEIIGKTAQEILDPAVLEADQPYHEAAMAGQRIAFEKQVANQDNKKQTFWVDLIPHFGVQGIKGFVALILDITDLKRSEAELRTAKEAAEAANQAKSTFLANMSHELRTPLNAILGFSQLLAARPDIDGDQAENLAVIRRSGKHLLNLINDVLDMSKIEAGRMGLSPVDFDLHRLLEDVTEMFRLRAREKGLFLNFEPGPDLPRYIHADQTKLRQILLNLLGNAVKFTENGGVDLRTRAHFSADRGYTLHFEVADTGPGIHEAEVEDIFEPFIQTRSGQGQQEGTGLGLPISRKYARMMGGDIRIASQTGEGTVFFLQIPAATAESRASESWGTDRTACEFGPMARRFRLLIADDQPDNRHLLRKLLDRPEFEIKEVADGQAAVLVFESWHPDLIWMDMRMPGMDGYEAARRIRAREHGKETVIVAVTASAFDDKQDRVRAAGCDDFLGKPFEKYQVYAILSKHLELSYACEEAAPSGPPVLDEKALFRIPLDIRTLLKEAAQRADMARVDELIAGIRQEDAKLALALAALADDFEYRTIAELMEKGEAHGNG